LLDDPYFYLFAIPAVILIGLAKGGFSGLGALGTPLIALSAGPVRGAAILLPILIVQDVVGVIAFRKSWDRTIIAIMLPGAVVGILIGYLLAAAMPTRGIMAVLGAITILFGAYRIWAERRGAIAVRNSSRWVGSLFGIATGFTSQIAHAGGPPFQMWVMPRRLDRDTFVGTSALFFAIVNWLKVPAYAALGQFSSANALASLALLPLAIAASLAGVWLVRRVAVERFYFIIYLLMIVTGFQLIFEGLHIV
jgi:uncharacterized membrane protein YfcA